MNKLSFSLLTLSAVLVFTPAVLADTYNFTFTGVEGQDGPVIATGVLITDGTPGPTPGSFDITSGFIDVLPGIGVPGMPTAEGGTGTLNVAFSDAFLTPGATGLTPFLDGTGLVLIFDVSGNSVSLYSDFNATGFTGAGTNDYGLTESSDYTDSGELTISPAASASTPEPSSYLLLGSGLLGLGLLAFRKAKPALQLNA